MEDTLDIMRARKESLRKIIEGNNAIGDIHRTHLNAHRGLYIGGDGTPLAGNRDGKKLVFFTRTMLNLRDENVRRVRRLDHLLNDKPNSVDRYVRMMLDPRLSFGDSTQPALKSDLVDEFNPFIPILSNTCTKLTGWPSTVIPTYTSNPGVMKESTTLVDGGHEIYGQFDLSATFKNVLGEAGLKLITAWSIYPTYTFRNQAIPYLDFMFEFEKDYESRIYIIVLAQNNKTVRRIGIAGACFPTNDSTAEFFDFDTSSNIKTENGEFSVTFNCTNAEYNDPILIEEFNEHVNMFNPMMDSLHNNETTHGMVLVPDSLHNLLSNHMYPRINPLNNNMEWWIERELLEIIPEGESNA